MPSDLERRLADLMRADAQRLRLLGHVRDLKLPDAWIGAGFVRAAVWDSLAGRPSPLPEDIDVIWHDPRRACPARDLALERRLARAAPRAQWSVKNQGRMHARNGYAPYACSLQALAGWPETATAVAVRLSPDHGLEVLAPFGLRDLFDGVIRPTPRFLGAKRAVFEARWQAKGWLDRWPFLRVAPC